MTRIYLSASLATLCRMHETGELPVHLVHAVTPGLREWYTEGDIEDLEYAAFTRAAQDALALLAGETGTSPRRVVVSADLPDGEIGHEPGELGDSHVTVASAVPLGAVAAIHVDGADAEADVAAACRVVEAARHGDPDAEFIVSACEDHELEWYDPSELEVLLKDRQSLRRRVGLAEDRAGEPFGGRVDCLGLPVIVFFAEDFFFVVGVAVTSFWRGVRSPNASTAVVAPANNAVIPPLNWD